MSTSSFANIDDLSLLWRSMTEPERLRAEVLLPLVSESLRAEADKVGKDLDVMIEENPHLEAVARSVTCDVVARTLMTSTASEPMTQFSQSAGGYTISGTYLVPGGGLFIKRSEIARLGLRRQTIGGIDFADAD